MKTEFFVTLAAVVAVALMAWPASADVQVTDFGSRAGSTTAFSGSGSANSFTPTGDYTIVPVISNTAASFFAGGPFVDSVFDNALDVIGPDLSGGNVESSDFVTTNGDGTFNLLLTLFSTSGDLAPSGLVDGTGVPLDTLSFLIGTGGGIPIDFGADIVNSAILTATTAAGVDVTGPIDLVPLGFDVQSGSIAVGFGAGSAGAGISTITLDINVTAAAIPEPTSIALLGVIGLGIAVRRRR